MEFFPTAFCPVLFILPLAVFFDGLGREHISHRYELDTCISISKSIQCYNYNQRDDYCGTSAGIHVSHPQYSIQTHGDPRYHLEVSLGHPLQSHASTTITPVFSARRQLSRCGPQLPNIQQTIRVNNQILSLNGGWKLPALEKQSCVLGLL